MVIKHLVLSGGGPSGFVTYGAIKQLHKNKKWNLENIKSIYGCSAGAIVGIIISLGYDWNLLDDYLIKRPWHKLVDIGLAEIVEFFNKKGVLHKDFFKDILDPLFTAKDISIDVTLKQLYDLTNIELHFFSTVIDNGIFKKIDISHKTHGSLKAVEAVGMSAAIPILVEPVYYNNKYYIDGGFLNNYPLNDCLMNQNCKSNEILAFKNKYKKSKKNLDNNIEFSHFICIVLKSWFNTLTSVIQKEPDIENTVTCLVESSFKSWKSIYYSQECRDEMIKHGEKQGELFLNLKKSSK